jgi:hypothetical protein
MMPAGNATVVARPVADVEPVMAETAEESNARVMSVSDEYAEAIEQSRWTPFVLRPDTTIADLILSIS